jgi:hypothetical protein
LAEVITDSRGTIPKRAIGRLRAHTLRRCPPHETRHRVRRQRPTSVPPTSDPEEASGHDWWLPIAQQQELRTIAAAGRSDTPSPTPSLTGCVGSVACGGGCDQSPSRLWIVSCLWWLVWHIDNLWVLEHRRLINTHTMSYIVLMSTMTATARNQTTHHSHGSSSQ